jgi:hypothetical protein
MSSTYTANKNLNKPARGDSPGTWDDPVNSDWDYIDKAFGGYILFSASSGSRTLTSGILDTYSYIPLTIRIAGTQSVNLVYTIPSGVGGQWLILNSATDATGGPYTTTFKTSSGSSVGVVVAKGVNTIIYSDGTEIYAVTTSSATTTNYQYVNKIINGNMLVDQRNSATTTTSATGTFATDRWFLLCSVNGKVSVGQNLGSTTPPTGFTKYLGVQTISAYTPLSADFFNVGQTIEGLNITDLSWGTSTAKTITLSFVARSSIAGTFGGAVQNFAHSYSYPFSFSIPVANTWTTVELTIPGPTTGVWPTDNAGSVILVFSVGTGATYSGTAGAWVGGNIIAPTGVVPIVSTSSATFYITGVQFEVGDSATPYQVQIYSDQLAQCQRYYYKGYFLNGWGSDQALFAGVITGLLQTPVPMRTTPTATGNVGSGGKLNFTDTTANYAQATGGWSIISSSGQAATSQYQSFTWTAGTFSSLTSYRPYIQSEYSGMPVDAPAILDAEF